MNASHEGRGQASPASAARVPRWKILGGFAVIYLVWGSTYFAIRVGVQTVPPFLFAAMRFLTAGILLFGWTLLRGGAWPTRKQWLGITVVAAIIFVGNYGLLFWAEQRVPSGLAAVMMATIALFMALAEIAILKTRRMTLRLGIALLIGIAGVAVLVTNTSSHKLAGPGVTGIAAVALVVSAMFFALGSVLTRKVSLPAAKATSSGAQMLIGGLLLTAISAALGDFRSFHPLHLPAAVLVAWAYLVLFGSIVGFTAYIWLLHHESPTRVGTYAYVNPVVAVLLGYFAGGEAIGLRAIAGTACVLVSVAMIVTGRK
jgi:drug/metabolite transporter (DMT)-like permease